MGLATANVIYGSDFTDYIDGNGGKDIVKAGKDDTVVLRLDKNGAIFDGGEGKYSYLPVVRPVLSIWKILLVTRQLLQLLAEEMYDQLHQP